MTKIVLKRGRAKPLWHGHPWVYGDAVARVEGEETPGAWVEVADDAGRLIGRGLLSPRSQIRVRMVTRGEEPAGDGVIADRIGRASALRRRLGLPSEATTAFRLVNSEGDGLPGLIVDLYGSLAVVQFTSLGLKQREEAVYDALMHNGLRAIVETAAGSFAAVEGFEVRPRVVRGEAPELVPCLENGLRFELPPLGGQKTGLFLDQRENRRRVGSLARGARVLDCYSYHGGFALAALAGGARSATLVDASARALERARANAALNGLPSLETHEADAFRFLEAASPRAYDLVVVDPPKFARAHKDLDAALKGYRRLNALALHTCAEDAVLATSSCSQAVDLDAFERVLASAAIDARRTIQILETASMGADHPLPPAFPEGRYLKFVLCRIS